MIPPSLVLPLVIGAASLAAGLATGWTLQGWRAEARIEAVRTELATAKGEHAKAAASAASAALAQSEAHRSIEAAWTRREQEAINALTKDRATLVAMRTRADSADAGLRDALNTIHCAAPGGGASDPATASSDHATPIGDVLGPLLAELRRTTAAAEDHAADLRAVLDAWPVNGTAPAP